MNTEILPSSEFTLKVYEDSDNGPPLTRLEEKHFGTAPEDVQAGDGKCGWRLQVRPVGYPARYDRLVVESCEYILYHLT